MHYFLAVQIGKDKQMNVNFYVYLTYCIKEFVPMSIIGQYFLSISKKRFPLDNIQEGEEEKHFIFNKITLLLSCHERKSNHAVKLLQERMAKKQDNLDFIGTL